MENQFGLDLCLCLYLAIFSAT